MVRYPYLLVDYLVYGCSKYSYIIYRYILISIYYAHVDFYIIRLNPKKHDLTQTSQNDNDSSLFIRVTLKYFKYYR